MSDKKSPTDLVRSRPASILIDAEAGDADAKKVVDTYRKHVADPNDETAADEARGAFSRWFGGRRGK